MGYFRLFQLPSYFFYLLGAGALAASIGGIAAAASCTTAGCVTADCFHTSNSATPNCRIYDTSTAKYSTYASHDPVAATLDTTGLNNKWKSSNCTKTCSSQSPTQASSCTDLSGSWNVVAGFKCVPTD